MVYRAAAALLAVLAVVAAGFLFRPASPPSPAERPSSNGALLPEVELEEPQAAPIMLEEPGHGQPVAIADEPEPVPAPLLRDSSDAYDEVQPTARWSDESRIDRDRIRAQSKEPVNSPPLNVDTGAD